MTRKTNLFHVSILGIVFFASQAFAQSQQTTLPVRVVDASVPIYRGQDESNERRGPTLVDRIKRVFNNWTRDDEDLSAPTSPQDSVRTTTPMSVPTKPPKPPTALEVKQSVENPEQARVVPERRTTVTNTERRRETVAPTVNAGPSKMPNSFADNSDRNSADEDQEESFFQRMEKMRTQIFDKQPVNENAYRESNLTPNPPASPKSNSPSVQRTQQPRNTQTETAQTHQVPQQVPQTQRVPANSILTTDEPVEQPMPVSRTERQSVPTRVAENDVQTRALSGVSVEPNIPRSTPQPQVRQSVQGTQADNQLRMARSEKKGHVSSIDEYQITSKILRSDRPGVGSPSIELETDSLQEPAKAANNAVPTADREKRLLVSPQLEVETEGEPRAIVGQEAIYRIRIANRGGVFAEQVVLSVEIPSWLELAQPEVSAGTTSVVPRVDNKELRDFVWKVSRIEAQAEELLVLHLIPQQRKSVDLRIKYDFFKPATVAKIVVQEPILEMELQGPDEVLWGSKVGYKLLVRNTGNGNAENVKLELLQTGSDMKSCELPVLKAGEEQVIDVDVWTGKQEHIDINIQATGMYDLAAKVNKRVKVMRPGIVMAVDSPTVQFVGNPAEFQIKVQNVGNAAARDIVLAAAIPLGAKFVSCTAGGELTPENQLVWKIDSILVGDVFTVSVVCEPRREGTCKLETSIGDRSGELANCTGSFEAEAIIELKLDVENPQGPIEVGQEAVYTLNISNRGTKAAENVEVRTAFGKGLEPFAVEGGNAYMSDGQVVFDKIPTITVGQNLVLKIKAKSEDSGNLKIRSEVVCSTANIHLVNENTTYFYQKQKGKSTTVVSSESSAAPAPAQAVNTEDPFLK